MANIVPETWVPWPCPSSQLLLSGTKWVTFETQYLILLTKSTWSVIEEVIVMEMIYQLVFTTQRYFQLLEEINYAVEEGVLPVAAAGNDGPIDGSIDYPGAYVKIIAVGAIDSTESVPDWSSRGINNGDYVIEEKEVEFGNPGVSIESTYNNGCYAYGNGTSMATPHVSGLAAKLWQGNAADTRVYLQNIAIDIWTTGDDTATGLGLPIAE